MHIFLGILVNQMLNFVENSILHRSKVMKIIYNVLNTIKYGKKRKSAFCSTFVCLNVA